MVNVQLSITMGALAPPLSEQLTGQLDEVSITNLQKLADAIVHLYIGGILTESEVGKSRKRLMKLICTAIDKDRALKQ